jgi:N-acetyl-gamma-glutamyl-phosphate reductase
VARLEEIGMEKVRVAVVGATGYTGAELLRLLLGHPRALVTRVIGHGKAGQAIAQALPSFRGVLDGTIAAFDADDVRAHADVAFLALPHGAAAEVAKELRARGVIVLDLSADFRLHDRAVHAEWYGEDHAPVLAREAVYGLPELHREALRTANLIAVPGCFPTASTLALAPLLRDRLVVRTGLVIDAKTGVSGAGRSPLPNTHFPETSEGIRAYKSAGQHRHTPEIEQELSAIAGEALRVVFTPHLVPMTRGILATAYAMAVDASVTAARCTEAARALYADSPVVAVLEPGSHPDTLWVRGSARAHVAFARDERTGMIVAQAAIDNLGKGASGQAVQCLNVRLGFDEDAGIRGVATFP